MAMSGQVLAHIRATGMDEKKYGKIQTFVDKIIDVNPKPDVDTLLAKFAAKCYASYPKAEGQKQAHKFLNVLYKDLNLLIEKGSKEALEKASSAKGGTKMRIVRLNKPVDGFTKKLDKYLVGETIGKGATSKVKLGRDSTNGRNVAIKILTADSKSFDMDELRKEIDVLKALRHKNIIRMYDCFENVLFPGSGKTSTTVVMVLELATKGELFDFFMHTGNFESPLARWFFKQMCDGIEYCHGEPRCIAHRDLKPENVLLGDGYLVKLVDFGFARTFKNDVGHTQKMSTALGTPGYAAPEILARQKYTANVDIFSLGVILFICIAGFPPFQEAKANDWWFDKIMKKKFALFWKAHERTHKFSDDEKDLLLRMLAHKPSDRITWEQIRKHPWVTDKGNGGTLTQAEAEERLRKRKTKVDKEKYEAAQQAGRTVPQKMVKALEMGKDKTVQPPLIGGYLPAYNFETIFDAQLVQEEIEAYIKDKMMGVAKTVKSGICADSASADDQKATDENAEEDTNEWEDLQFTVSTSTGANAQKKEVDASSEELPPVEQAFVFEGIMCVRLTGREDKDGIPTKVVYFKRQREGPGTQVGTAKKWNTIVNRIIDAVAHLIAPPDLETFIAKKKEIETPENTAKNPFAVLPGMNCCSTGN